MSTADRTRDKLVKVGRVQIPAELGLKKMRSRMISWQLLKVVAEASLEVGRIIDITLSNSVKPDEAGTRCDSRCR